MDPDNRPDPTQRTTELLWREVSALRDLLTSRIDGVEKAITVAHDDLVRVPTDVQKQVGNLKELHEEKFRSIETQFTERDVRVEHTARDTKTAVDAALAAQEKAAGKSEAAIMKQIDLLATSIQTATRALDDKINDAKDRLTRIEGKGEGTSSATTSQQAGGNYIMAIISTLIAIAALAFAFLKGR